MTQVYGPFLSLVQAREQGLKHYFTGKPCRNGHLSLRSVNGSRCVACNAEGTKRYHDKNREQKRAKDREYNAANPQRHRDRVRVYRQNNLSAVSAYHKQYQKERRLNDPSFVVVERLRCRLRDALRSQKAYSPGTMTLLGCTKEEACKHLENQFLAGMTWENLHLWHIDHIRPVASFDDPADPRCWHYTNLQPLWAEDNRAKSDKWSPDSNC